jgi:hypothetical protein
MIRGMAEAHVTPEMLTKRTTYAEWVANLGLVDPPAGKFLERIEKYGSRLSKLMQSGDELWEWKTGTDFAAAGGFAILRDGKIVWAESTWRS